MSAQDSFLCKCEGLKSYVTVSSINEVIVTTLWFGHLSCQNIIDIVSRTSLVSSDSKTSAYNAGDLGSIPGAGRSTGEGNGNPLQYSCLENPMDRGAW